MAHAEYLTRARLVALATELLDTFELYPHRQRYSEKHLEFALCALLRRTVTQVTPQARAATGSAATGRGRRDQIDFRTGTTNRVFVEFAVRRKNKHGQVGGWKGSENESELRKLRAETAGGTRHCYLLIVDISREPALTQAGLEASYAPVWAGLPAGGRAVTVLYVHPAATHMARLA